jgi:hypothetical protein
VLATANKKKNSLVPAVLVVLATTSLLMMMAASVNCAPAAATATDTVTIVQVQQQQQEQHLEKEEEDKLAGAHVKRGGDWDYYNRPGWDAPPPSNNPRPVYVEPMIRCSCFSTNTKL